MTSLEEIPARKSPTPPQAPQADTDADARRHGVDAKPTDPVSSPDPMSPTDRYRLARPVAPDLR